MSEGHHTSITRPRTVGLSATEHAAVITRQWTAAVSGIVACGRALIEAKASLDHGDFTAMIEELLPFSSRTARKLMSIAQNTWIADRNHMDRLPPAWTTLYELSLLTEDALERAAAEGVLRPEMERTDAVRLRRPLAPPPPAAPALEHHAGQAVRYGAILADPPWRFETWSDNGRDRSPERHYPTMTIEEICALPVPTIAAEDCALFLWAHTALLPDAFRVIEAWGFSYKTKAFNWVKDGHYGNGYWTRQRAEDCLLATRGRPQRLNADVDQVIIGARAEHSAKPEDTAARIERLVPGPYIELFARRRRDGWDRWGNEIDKLSEEAT